VRDVCDRASCLENTWAWGLYKMKRKIEASNEVLHKILGTIDTREKFEARTGSSSLSTSGRP
jgi:nitrate/TMAO reductase-like tetraheme cytochrome c subunit